MSVNGSWDVMGRLARMASNGAVVTIASRDADLTFKVTVKDAYWEKSEEGISLPTVFANIEALWLEYRSVSGQSAS